MPIYEYHCEACGHDFEELQKITDSPVTDCEHCHAKVHRLISKTSFQLKGGGWYSDLYGSSSGKSGTKASTSSGSSSSSSSASASSSSASASSSSSASK